ncbi:TetR/AcrR family transcriptional regulator [Actinomyces oris]|uniref:TetR/AcrR family transcriptional regulator n=1 Tax=Actinomyces oris TaxID=544580 RepID=UPI0028EB3F0E|nr:helix-turn-helix domain-containing protein [Actinomyces oris]
MARVTHDAAARAGVVKEGSGATSERSARRADAVRNRTAILEAAKQLVTEQGAEVAMGEIARVAGVAVGTLYRHFPNKADLLAAVVNEYVDALADDAQGAWERVESGRSEADQELLDFLERALEMVARSHAAKTVARALGAEVEYAEPENRATEALGRLIEAGRSSGRLRRDLTVSDLYILMVFYPGEGSVEVRRRWLELIRPGLLEDGQ